MKQLLLAIAVLTFLWLSVSAQDCALPTNAEISNLLRPLLANADSGNPSDYSPSIIGSVHYVCQAQGSIRGTYRAVSIISTFVPNGGPNSTVQRTNIFEFTCASGTWDINGQLATPPNGLINAPTRTDCFACSPIFATDRCRQCASSCRSTCLGRCVGSETTCCATFTADGTCTADTGCDSFGINYIATESTGCSCACNLTCTAGYSPNSNCTVCDQFTDICERDMPCQNGGDCTLLSAPANYTCNCTDTGYGGVNCTDLIPSPSPSLSPPLPSPSPSPCTLSGCDECDDFTPGCCKTCLTSYSITDGCNCGIVTPSVTSTVLCIVPGCDVCMVGDMNCCRVCSDGLVLDTCKCLSTTGSISTLYMTDTVTAVCSGSATSEQINDDRISVTIAAVSVTALLTAIVTAVITSSVFCLIMRKRRNDLSENPIYDQPSSTDYEMINLHSNTADQSAQQDTITVHSNAAYGQVSSL